MGQAGAATSDAFFFCTCQIGAEPALKDEIARDWPGFRFAFSRPGFLTFKTAIGHLPDDFDPRAVFVRACGLSLGKVSGSNDAERAAAAWRLAGERLSRAARLAARSADGQTCSCRADNLSGG